MEKGTNPLAHGHSQERTEDRAGLDWTVRGCSPGCWGEDEAESLGCCGALPCAAFPVWLSEFQLAPLP